MLRDNIKAAALFCACRRPLAVSSRARSPLPQSASASAWRHKIRSIAVLSVFGFAFALFAATVVVLPAQLEKVLQHLPCLPGENAAAHRGVAVEPFVGKQVQQAAGAGFRLVGGIHQPADARLHHRAGAHYAGLEADVKVTGRMTVVQQGPNRRNPSSRKPAATTCTPWRERLTLHHFDSEITLHLRESIDKFQKVRESAVNPNTLNEENSNPSGFRSYSVNQAMNIIWSIAEHRWPMTVDEAFSLRDQFGWTPAPDDGRFFVTSVSNGEEDGTISIDRENRIYISGIRFKLTSQLPKDADPNIQSCRWRPYLLRGRTKGSRCR